MSSSAQLAPRTDMPPPALPWHGFAPLKKPPTSPYDAYAEAGALRADLSRGAAGDCVARLSAVASQLAEALDFAAILRMYEEARPSLPPLEPSSLSDPHVDLLIKVANASIRCTALREAEELLEAVVAARPANVPARRLLASVLRVRQPGMALRHLQEVSRLPGFGTHLASTLTYLDLLREHGLAGLARAEILRLREPANAADLLLAMANLERAATDKLVFLNGYLETQGLAPLALRPAAALMSPGNLLLLPQAGPDMAGPLISVVMTTFNAAAHVRDAVRSVQAQTHGNWELLIVDDASTDGTPAILRELQRGDARIQLILCERNAGTYVAKNMALSQCRGEFVTCQDSDDIALPDKLRRQLEALRARPAQLANYSRWLRIDPAGQFQLKTWGMFAHINPASLLFRRQPVLDSIGFFDGVRVGADTEFRMRILARHGGQAVAMLDDTLTLGLHHGASLTQSGAGATDEFGVSPVRRAYASSWLDWHVANLDRPRALYRGPAQEERPFPVPGSILPEPRADDALPDRPAMTRLTAAPRRRGAASAAGAEVLHVLDLGTDSILASVMLNQAAIELANGQASRIWNIRDHAAASFSWQGKRLFGLCPEAFVTDPPGSPRLAFAYGPAILEELARRFPATPPAPLVVAFARNKAEGEEARKRLAELGWRGSALTVNGLLFGQRGREDLQLWDVALSAALFDEAPPAKLRIGLSYCGRSPGAEDLAFIGRLRKSTGLPVVALVEEADMARAAAAGAETVLVQRRRNFWSDFFARATLLVLDGGDLARAALLDVAGQALQRGRLILALSAETLPTPGASRFAGEAELAAFLRGLREDPARLREALATNMAAFSAGLGEDHHLRRIARLLQEAGPAASPAASPATEAPEEPRPHPAAAAKPDLAAQFAPRPAEAAPDLSPLPADAPALTAEPEEMAAFLAEGEWAAIRAWLRRGPRVMPFRRALQRLEHQRAILRIIDLHDQVESRPDEVAGMKEELHFWLRVHAAGAFSNAYARDTSLRIMEALEASPLRARLDGSDLLAFEQKRATVRGRAGQPQERVRILRDLLATQKGNWSLRAQLAAALQPQDPAEALAQLRTAWAEAPQPAPAPLSVALAGAMSLAGEHEEALRLLQGAVKAHGDTPGIRLALANAHLGLGRREDWATVLAPILPRQGGIPAVRISPRSDLPILEAFQPGRIAPLPAGPDTPLVTVIMTAYNAEASIEAAMRSVLAQTHAKLRLIVVDDVSTDGTREVVRRVARQDPRVAMLEQERNGGTYAAKNRALALVASDFYTFLDSDDWMHPCRIERHLAYMAAHPSAVCTYSRWIRLDPLGRVVVQPQENPASSFFRRALIDECGPFDMVRASADGEFRWRLRRRFGHSAVPTMDEILTIGTQREGSLTTGGPTAFDEHGYSALRVAYAEAWSRWHRGAGDPGALVMPYPQRARPFEAPPELGAPPLPSCHPFDERPAEEKPPEGAIVVEWPISEAIVRNWGDKLNPELVSLMSGRAAVNHRDPLRNKASPVHLVIGSGLTNTSPQKIVWGSGFIRHDELLRKTPLRICAVRGPLSRQRVLLTEPSCPEVFGDPALLYPLFYHPEIEPRHDIGLIQHCRESSLEPLPLLQPGLSVRVIDINGGLHEVIDAILSCRHILSSSLHGLIAAHAYGLPATWLRFSDRLKGDGFKFKDYWASMGRDAVEPLQVTPGEVLDHRAGIATPGRIRVDLHRLIRACPFIDDARKEELVARSLAMRPKAHPMGILNRHAGLDDRGA